MKVTIDFGSEIEPAVQRHLDGGGSVQNYIQAALVFFNALLHVEEAGNSVGYGDKARFGTYNKIVSPSEQLHFVNEVHK